MTLVPPFPYFGGKRRVADIVWQALGDVATYCEPFAGGAAVLLGRPAWHRQGQWHEVLNDLDGHVTNAWRAIQADPDGVWQHCNRPHSEHDLTAWRAELSRQYGSLVEQLEADPRWYDVEAAGVWVWGQCVCIGRGWSGRERPVAGQRTGTLADINLSAVTERLRDVYILRGDWRRAARHAQSLWNRNKLIAGQGYFLDPPYDGHESLYAESNLVAQDVAQWCRDNAHLRIVLAGYEGHYDLPGWRCVPWKARGGYGNQSDGDGRDNSKRERLWLSPACLPLESERQRSLF